MKRIRPGRARRKNLVELEESGAKRTVYSLDLGVVGYLVGVVPFSGLRKKAARRRKAAPKAQISFFDRRKSKSKKGNEYSVLAIA